MHEGQPDHVTRTSEPNNRTATFTCQSAEGNSTRSDQSAPQGFYYWEFREQNGPRLLAIRKPQGEPFTVTLFQKIPASDVTIYRRA